MLHDLIMAAGISKPLPLALWRSGSLGSIPKVNNLPTTPVMPTTFSGYGCRPQFIKAFNNVLYMVGWYLVSTNVYKGIFKSIDNGLTWTTKNGNITAIPLTYNFSDFIITASGRMILQTFASVAMYYSDDEGVTWTSVSANKSSLNAMGYLASNGNTVILAGRNSTYGSQLYVSLSRDNGSTWTQKQVTTSGMEGMVPVYGNGRWIIYAQTGGTCRISTDDGNTWSAGGNAGGGKDIRFVNGKFIATASNQTSITWSVDGITWTTIQIPTGISGINSIDYDPVNNVYVFVGQSPAKTSQYIGTLSSDMTTVTQYGYPPEIQSDANKQNLPFVICNGNSVITLTDPASKCFISP